MIYLASPYTHEDPEIVLERFLIVERCAAELMRRGHVVFSPIVHCHEIAAKYNLPTNFGFWKNYNFGVLQRATTLWILKIPGWEMSAGVQAEKEFARDSHIPICWITPEWACKGA